MTDRRNLDRSECRGPRGRSWWGIVAAAAAPMLVVGLLPGTAAAAPTVAKASYDGPVPTAKADTRIGTKIPKRLRQKPLGRAVSVKVAGLEGDAIYAYRAGRRRLPASNMKLITAVATMHTLGLDTRLPTTVVAAGAGGRKAVLVAGGDPVLTTSQLTGLAQRTATALVAKLPAAPTDPTDPVVPAPAPAVRAVKLKVFVDDSLYAAPTLAPGWPSGYISSGVVRPVRPLVRDGRYGSDTSLEAARYFEKTVATQVARQTADRPDLAVKVRFRGRTTAPDDAPTLASFEGNSVRAALSWMLLVSDNNIAEMFFRDVAVARGLPATWAGASSAVTASLRELGIPTGKLTIADGSGVSRSDRVTSTALIRLLQRAASPDHPELNALRSLLPVSGVSGTLKSSNGRYSTPPTSCARGKIAAKTGTLHDTVALSGYTTGADGQTKVFSILVNKRPEARYSPLATRRAVDKIAATVNGCM